MSYGILPGAVQHQGYVPMESHGMSSEGYYTHPYYHSRPPYYAPHPGAMQTGFRLPDYYGPAGEGYYTAPYMHTMYPHPHFPHGYQPPDMYHDHNIFPSMPHSTAKLTSRPSQETTGEAEKETFASELKLRTAESADHIKAEAEHPKTPDNLSGEGTVRLIDRQGSTDDRSSTAATTATTTHVPDTSSQRSLLRRMSLPKSASQKLKSRINSVDLDWGEQVEAEENYRMSEGRKFSKPSEETVVPIAVSSPPTSDPKGLDVTADVPPEATSPEGWQGSHSPTSRETSQRDRSTDASTRRSEKSVSGQWRSGGGSYQNPSHQDRWQVQCSGTSTPAAHRAPPMESPSRHRNVQEGWQDRREGAYRDRGFRGRDGYRGRGRSGRPSPGDRLMSTAAVEGRKHFPGRGFRPKGIPPRQGHSGPGPNETPGRQDRTIQFGRFDMSLEGDYDPFSGSVPIFESNSVDDAGKRERLPDSLNSDVAAKHEEQRPPTAPNQLDPVAIDSFGGEVPSHVYADHEEGRSTPGSRGPLSTSGAGSRMEGGRGGPRGRYSFNQRGRHRGGRWSHGRHGGSMDRFRHHPSSFSSASGTPTESERRFQRKDGYFAANHRWSHDFSSRGRGDWHDRPFDRNPYHHNRPNTRGGYGRGRGRGRGGREGGRAFQGRRSQDNADSGVRSPTSKAPMQWVPKKPSAEVTEKEQPAEE